LKCAEYENLERAALSYIYVVLLVIFISNENVNEIMGPLKSQRKPRDEGYFLFEEWFNEMQKRFTSLKKEIFGW
jgi:hypothetical protein